MSMATAMKARQATRRSNGRTQVKGEFVAQMQVDGEWVKVSTDRYEDDHRRAALLKAHTEWANSAPRGAVRRIVENCTVDGKPRHIIRAESMQGQPDGDDEYPDHDAEALRQFLADETGLAWKVYNVQGVDYSAPDLQ